MLESLPLISEAYKVVQTSVVQSALRIHQHTHTNTVTQLRKMQMTPTSLLVASVVMLVAAKPAPQGSNPNESKFVNAAVKQSCKQVPGGNGYYCDALANLYYCTSGYAQLCQRCGQATNFNQPSGCTASDDGEAGNCYGTSAGAKQC